MQHLINQKNNLQLQIEKTKKQIQELNEAKLHYEMLLQQLPEEDLTEGMARATRLRRKVNKLKQSKDELTKAANTARAQLSATLNQMGYAGPNAEQMMRGAGDAASQFGTTFRQATDIEHALKGTYPEDRSLPPEQSIAATIRRGKGTEGGIEGALNRAERKVRRRAFAAIGRAKAEEDSGSSTSLGGMPREGSNTEPERKGLAARIGLNMLNMMRNSGPKTQQVQPHDVARLLATKNLLPQEFKDASIDGADTFDVEGANQRVSRLLRPYESGREIMSITNVPGELRSGRNPRSAEVELERRIAASRAKRENLKTQQRKAAAERKRGTKQLTVAVPAITSQKPALTGTTAPITLQPTAITVRRPNAITRVMDAVKRITGR